MTTENKPGIAFAVVTRGNTTEVARAFEMGRVFAPFSVGAQGDWYVVAAGVERRHVYLCFDGSTLFATVLAGGPVASVDGRCLGVRWTALPHGSRLVFGAASITVTNPGDGTNRAPPLSERRTDPRGPRVRDPFASETLVAARISPVPAVREEAGDPCDEPTLMYLPRLVTPPSLVAPGPATPAREKGCLRLPLNRLRSR